MEPPITAAAHAQPEDSVAEEGTNTLVGDDGGSEDGLAHLVAERRQSFDATMDPTMARSQVEPDARLTPPWPLSPCRLVTPPNAVTASTARFKSLDRGTYVTLAASCGAATGNAAIGGALPSRSSG